MKSSRSFVSRKREGDLTAEYLRKRNRKFSQSRRNELPSEQADIQNLTESSEENIPNSCDVQNFEIIDSTLNDTYDDHTRSENSVENSSLSEGDRDDHRSCNSSENSDVNSSDTSSPDDEHETLHDFIKQLGDVFVNTNMTHVQMKEILKVLHIQPCFSYLPKDPRTILSTPWNSVRIESIAGGEYLHLGIENTVIIILESTPLNLIPSELWMDFFTDEASLDKASVHRIWPIEIRIANIDRCKPEPVGIWKGDIKPTDPVALMKPFVGDFLSVVNSGGIVYDNALIPLKIRCFIADSPARAFIKGHLGHNSTFPCCKCYVQGEYIHSSRVMVFKGVDHPLRSSESYKNKVDGEHHKEGEGSLDKLPMDLVSQTVFEYMHLCCLGVMKKILDGIIDGKFAARVSLSEEKIQIVNLRLLQIKECCPADFARKPLKIKKYSKYKATEFRQILLYTGIAIFSGLVENDVLLHFSFLNSAIRIYSSPNPSENLLNLAENFIKLFVLSAENIYGAEFLTYVTHGLLHIIQDVRKFGPIDSYSAFPYKNHMTYFRRVCRKPNQHLQQIYNRRNESRRCAPKLSKLIDSIQLKGEHNSGPLVSLLETQSCSQFSRLQYNDASFSLKNADNTVICSGQRIGIIKNFIQINNRDTYIIVNFFENIEDLYHLSTFPSSQVGMFKVSSLSKNHTLIPLNDVLAKCFRMPFWSVENSSSISKKGEFTVATLISYEI
uniref:DUF4218 domain-containing protein n=1 Tax=Trichogramma kaykai TaxID=54128 RepID=A0ABD2X1T5_9HYME